MISGEQVVGWETIIDRCRKRFQPEEALSNPDVWFGVHLREYLKLLHGAQAVPGSGGWGRRAASKRRDRLQAFRTYLGREATAEDVLDELTKIAEVPPFVEEAIRHDFKPTQRRT